MIINLFHILITMTEENRACEKFSRKVLVEKIRCTQIFPQTNRALSLNHSPPQFTIMKFYDGNETHRLNSLLNAPFSR